ncbi:MAG TPA: lysophospholipid acyltransferase family protein [Symbiobacteriaceae bacterium]|nr:lysophospholipid acyltransferase family protein [Symbiobacteriaceae bacterium]
MLRTLFDLLSMLPAGGRRKVTRWMLDRIWSHFTTTQVIGRENVPQGPCLFICNHLSNADGVTLYRALRPKVVFFLAGVKLQDTVMTRVVANAMDTIPIRPGSPDVEALKRAVETLRHGQSVLIFPEGTRSRTGALLRAKKGAALIARRAGVPIVPVALTGTEKFLPINDADMGGENVSRAAVTVRFGRPFTVADLAVVTAEGDDDRQALADAMMRRVAELLPAEYQGEYRVHATASSL